MCNQHNTCDNTLGNVLHSGGCHLRVRLGYPSPTDRSCQASRQEVDKEKDLWWGPCRRNKVVFVFKWPYLPCVVRFRTLLFMSLPILRCDQVRRRASSFLNQTCAWCSELQSATCKDWLIAGGLHKEQPLTIDNLAPTTLLVCRFTTDSTYNPF